MTSEVLRRFHEVIRNAAQRLGYFPSREDHTLAANPDTVDSLRRATALGGIVDTSVRQNDLMFMGVPVRYDPSVPPGEVRLVGVDMGRTDPDEVSGVMIDYDVARMTYVCRVTFADNTEVRVDLHREDIENRQGVPAGLDARDRGNWAQAIAVNEARMQRRRAIHGGLPPTVPVYGTQPGRFRASAAAAAAASALGASAAQATRTTQASGAAVRAAQPEPCPPPSDTRVMDVPTGDLPAHPVRNRRPRLIGD